VLHQSTPNKQAGQHPKTTIYHFKQFNFFSSK
jgi:hypothetical protein